jgi:aspartyl-tRNA(Asn)/glutamyl-tRNA(Gln) amidotransferase subunit C
LSNITEKDVEYVANLAQLTLDDETKSRLVGELSNILDYIDKLNTLNTDGVEPMMHVQPMTNVFRDDEIAPSLDRDAFLERAPKHDGEYILVPQILEGD